MPMLMGFIDFLDQRTGFRSILKAMLYEHIPGGARWRYVWGSTLVFAFLTQAITGIFLWLYYSPSSQSAWESVHYIQHQVEGGWLLRGIHHYTAQAMVVLLGLHMLQVIIDGAYRAPREFNFWVGLLLLLVVLGLGLTGYLLPWDQKGYWATKVATNLTAISPVAGEEIKRVLVGGPEYGHFTLTRFFALHAGVLPAVFIGLTALHVYLFRRHGIHANQKDGQADGTFWPDQVLKDAVACLAVFAVVTLLAVWHPAPLMAPADPTDPYSAARPEWYFLFLYQFLKLFEGESTIWGAIYIPGLAFLVLALMPIVGRVRVGHFFNVVMLLSLITAALGLTVVALRHDADSEEFQVAVAAAERDAGRIHDLVRLNKGIPPTGARTLLEEDPYTQGPRLFAKHCASCHRWGGEDGAGKTPKEAPRAADLKGFGSREWLADFLKPELIATPRFFGGTAFKEGKMAAEQVQKAIAGYTDEKKAKLAKVVLAVSAEAALPSQAEKDKASAQDIELGRQHFGGGTGNLNCARCHKLRDAGDLGKAPDLTGWGSREWLIGIISDPAHERFYSEENDRMPRFGAQEILEPKSIELLADWIRGEWAR